MRRRARRSEASPESLLGLDSFMDIVTNVIGVLFFVIVFAALSATGAKGRVITPMLAEGTTEGMVFVCHANTVFFPDVDGLLEASNAVWKKAGEEGITDWQKKFERLREANIENEFYRYEPMVRSDSGKGMLFIVEKLVLRPEAAGDDLVQIRRPGSSFVRALEALDPTRQHVFLLVETDSFEVFHAARRLAAEKGFSVGWDPIEKNMPLIFSSGGGGSIDIGSHF